jgi:hypothetical protein
MRAAAVALLLVPAALGADEVYLKGGGQITGQIVARTELEITVDIGAGTLGVPVSKVERIEEGRSALQECRDRAAAIAPGDAEAWRELARWAEEEGLSSQAQEAWEQVLAVDPADPEANRAMGLVELDGRWVTEEESWRERGYVQLDGEWMTPEERDLVVEERHAQAEAEDRALAEQLRREHEAQQESAAREAGEWEDDAYYYGDPVYWGWAPGPGYWPDRPVDPGRPGSPGGPGRPAQLPARPAGRGR